MVRAACEKVTPDYSIMYMVVFKEYFELKVLLAYCAETAFSGGGAAALSCNGSSHVLLLSLRVIPTRLLIVERFSRKERMSTYTGPAL